MKILCNCSVSHFHGFRVLERYCTVMKGFARKQILGLIWESHNIMINFGPRHMKRRPKLLALVRLQQA